MNWYMVVNSLQLRAREQLHEAQENLRNGELHSGQSNLTSAGVLIGLADALREGLKADARSGFTDGILP